MLNGAFGAGGPDLYPEALSSEIDAVNERVYDRVNGEHRSAEVALLAEPVFERVEFREQGGEGVLVSVLLGGEARLVARPISACSPRWCGSMRSMSGISSATGAGSPTTPTSGTISAPKRRARSLGAVKSSSGPSGTIPVGLMPGWLP
jgi:hypothetical protein